MLTCLLITPCKVATMLATFIIANVFPCSPMAFTISTCGGVSTRAFFYVAFFSQAHTKFFRYMELVEAIKKYSLITYYQQEACKSKKNKDSYGKLINHEQP